MTGRVIPKSDRETLVYYEHLLHSIAERKEPVIGRVETDYYRNSKEMGNITHKDGNYWDSNVELTARAFATYIMDKLPWRSDYLAGHAECAINFKAGEDGKLEIQWLDRAEQQWFKPVEATFEVDETGEISKTGKVTDKTVTVTFDADGKPVISEPEPEQREIHVGDKILMGGKKWLVAKIDGDFSLSLKNLNPDDIQSDQMFMGRWKEKLDEAGYTILTEPEVEQPASQEQADTVTGNGDKQYPAPTPPPNLNPKNTMPHKNYTRFSNLFSKIIQHPDAYHDISYCVGKNGDTLLVCWEDKDTLTLTRIADDKHDPILHMRVNEDEKTLNTLVLEQNGVFLGVDGTNEEVMSDVYGRLDSYLAEWMRDIETQGHKIDAAQIYSDDSKRLGKIYFNESGKAFWIGMGHMGNGLTVWNRLEEKHGDYGSSLGACLPGDFPVTFQHGTTRLAHQLQRRVRAGFSPDFLSPPAVIQLMID